MAIYTIQIKTVSRSAGHSATAKIAYNCRDKITDQRSDEIHKYDSKKMSADLIHSEITYKDLTLDKKERSEIWNNAELAENRKDSRTAREYVVALPKELSNEQNILLVREFAAELTTKFNNVADWAIHAGRDGNGNIHAHILTTTRTFDPETKQLGERTSIEWNNTKCQANNVPVTQEQIKTIRKDWEQIQNKHLAMAGLDLSVSCERKEDRDSVKKHLGKEAVALERRGVETELGSYNRTIDNVLELSSQVYSDGAELAKQRAELEKLERLQQEMDKQKQLEEQLSRQRELARHQELIRAAQIRAELKAQEDQEIERLKVPAENNIGFGAGTPYKLFDIAREHGEFFTKQTKGDYEYWSSRDGAVEVHATHVNVHKPNDANIELALDIAVSKFGNNLSINGGIEFKNKVVDVIAANKEFAEIRLSDPLLQQRLEDCRMARLAQEKVDTFLAANPTNSGFDFLKNIATNYEKDLAARELAQQERTRLAELSAFRAEQARLTELNRSLANDLRGIAVINLSDRIMEEFKQLTRDKPGLYVDSYVVGLERNAWFIQDRNCKVLGLVEGNKLYSNNLEVKETLAAAEINLIKQLKPERFAIDELSQALSNSGYSVDSKGFIRDQQNSRVAWLGEKDNRSQQVFIVKPVKFEPLRQELNLVQELKHEATRKQARGFGMEM